MKKATCPSPATCKGRCGLPPRPPSVNVHDYDAECEEIRRGCEAMRRAGAKKAASPEGRRYAEEMRRAGLGPVMVYDNSDANDEVRRRIPGDLGIGDSMKSTKKKAAKAAVDTNQVEHVIKTILSPRTQRISALEKILRKAEAANDRQTVGSLSAQLYQARAAKDREEAALTLASLGVTTSADSQAAAIAAASAPAIRRVQDGGPSMTGSSNPRGALQAVLSGQYTRESPPSTTILPSQRRILDLEAQQNIEQLRKQLDEAMASKDMQRASELSYRLTKTQLVDGHRRGVC